MASTASPNPIVFLDVSVGGQPSERMEFELFAKTTPKTSENFFKYCIGELRDDQGKPIGYKGSLIHRVIPHFMIQGGDFINNNGTGSTCIWGTKSFKDENFIHRHDEPGLLSMANNGPDTNGCQFFITTAPQPHLNGKHVVFGRIVSGITTLRKIEYVPTFSAPADRPRMNIVITECGEM